MNNFECGSLLYIVMIYLHKSNNQLIPSLVLLQCLRFELYLGEYYLIGT